MEWLNEVQRYLTAGGRSVVGSWDAVNLPMIRHWCDAMGDTNPVYLDEDFAANTPFEGIVAPPAMLQAWTMTGATGKKPPGSEGKDPFRSATLLMEQNGFASVVATNCEQRYYRYLKLGERLHFTSRLEAVSEQKKTALGTGYFLTQYLEYFNGQNEKVADMRFRVLRYTPAKDRQQPEQEPHEATAKPLRPRPGVNRDNAFFWQGLQNGKLCIQRCSACSTLRHPPSPMCKQCHSLDFDTVQASGKGVIYSLVNAHHPRLPGLPNPNPIALIELEEGTRLVAGISGAGCADMAIGKPVMLDIVHCDADLSVPVFRPLNPAEERATGNGPTAGKVSEGERLPPLSIDITTKLIVSAAIASRDYQDVHHDRVRAQELGSPDIFMNILTTNGLVGRYVTDWVGPEGIIQSISIQLGVPNYPGDRMVFNGEIIAKSDTDEGQSVQVKVEGNNSLGTHVSATVTLILPLE